MFSICLKCLQSFQIYMLCIHIRWHLSEWRYIRLSFWQAVDVQRPCAMNITILFQCVVQQLKNQSCLLNLGCRNAKTWFRWHDNPWNGKPWIYSSMNGHVIWTDNLWIESELQTAIWIQEFIFIWNHWIAHSLDCHFIWTCNPGISLHATPFRQEDIEVAGENNSKMNHSCICSVEPAACWTTMQREGTEMVSVSKMTLRLPQSLVQSIVWTRPQKKPSNERQKQHV